MIHEVAMILCVISDERKVRVLHLFSKHQASVVCSVVYMSSIELGSIV